MPEPVVLTLSVTMPNGATFSASGPKDEVLNLYADWRRVVGFDPTISHEAKKT